MYFLRERRALLWLTKLYVWLYTMSVFLARVLNVYNLHSPPHSFVLRHELVLQTHSALPCIRYHVRHLLVAMDPINNTQATLPPPPGGLIHTLLNPSPLGLLIAILLAATIPIFLHTVVFRSAGLTTLPSILLIGPSGSGKTALVTLVCTFRIHCMRLQIADIVLYSSSVAQVQIRIPHNHHYPSRSNFL
jgi:hypothetical protein